MLLTEGIIIAIITVVGSFAGNLIVNNKHQQLLQYRLGELEKKVDTHNKVIERTYALEKENSV